MSEYGQCVLVFRSFNFFCFLIKADIAFADNAFASFLVIGVRGLCPHVCVCNCLPVGNSHLPPNIKYLTMIKIILN